MGEWFEFKCPACGYRTQVPGGEDCGEIAVTETMVCEKCRELVDVMVGFAIPSPEKKTGQRHGPCPRCHGDDVTPWGKERPCPKCGKRMIKGESVCLWD